MSETVSGFQNRSLPPQELPDMGSVRLNPVAPVFRRYLLLSTTLWVVGLVVAACLAAWLFLDGRFLLPIIAGAGGLLLSGWLHAWLDPRYRGWAVREHDLIARAGVLWRKTVVLPVVRVQHVETASGPLERAFGLVRLKCFSAGGMSADLDFHGLDRDTALRIRNRLMQTIEAETGRD